jgi:hypothetical protein
MLVLRASLGKAISKCYNRAMSRAGTPTQVMYADPDHGGVRGAVLVTIGAGLLISFFFLRWLFNRLTEGTQLQDFTTLFSCVGAIVLALGIAYLIENSLKRVWHSGFVLTLDDDALHFDAAATEDFDAIAITMDWSKRVNLTRWYFQLANYPRAGRERMVSAKWICLACQMQQDDSRLIVYAYYPPEEAAVLTDDRKLSEPFHELSLARLYREAGASRWSAMTRPSLPPDLLAGENGRYWLAERRRWEEGLELSKEDFKALMKYVEARVA